MLKKPQIVQCCSQLAGLVEAGCPVYQALQIMARAKPALKLTAVIAAIAGGDKLADALSCNLPPMAIGLIRIAETNGTLVASLRRLADYYEEQAELEGKIISALIYPLTVIIVGLMVLGGVVFWLLPMFSGLLLETGGNLPWLTRSLLALPKIAPWLFGIMVVGILFLTYYLRRNQNWWLYVPLLGLAIRQNIQLQYCYALGAMLAGKVPLTQALQIIIDINTWPEYQAKYNRLLSAVNDGAALSQAMQNEQLCQLEICQVVEIGEKSGKLASALTGVARQLEREKEQQIKRWLVLLEPLVTLLVGIFVGLVALAVMLPMINLVNAIQ